jgi:hypothetical protein
VPTTVLTETFTGITNGSPWPAANWVATSNFGIIDVQSSRGRLQVQPASTTHRARALALMAPVAAFEVYATFAFASTDPLAGSFLRFWLRSSNDWLGGASPNDGYGVDFRADSPTLRLLTAVGNVVTTVNSANVAVVTTTRRALRAQVIGDTLSAKTWDVLNDPEPAGWQIEHVCPPILSAGVLQVALRAEAATTLVQTATVDDVSVTDLETGTTSLVRIRIGAA